MYIHRSIENILNTALEQFPVTLITGARQAGKSTLLQFLLPNYKYITFDDPKIRLMGNRQANPY